MRATTEFVSNFLGEAAEINWFPSRGYNLDGITHDQTIICRQLFAGHLVGSQPMKMGEKSIE